MIYETIYKQLLKLIPNIWNMNAGDSQISKASCFMDLHLDILQKNENGMLISLAHYYEQNGDLIPDPDIRIKVYRHAVAEALTYQDSYIFQCASVAEALTYQDSYISQCVYPEPDKVNVRLKPQLNSFLSSWLKNCLDQEHHFESVEPQKISVEWTVKDVINICPILSVQQAEEILQEIQRGKDTILDWIAAPDYTDHENYTDYTDYTNYNCDNS
jgi:uncharacterized protein YqiB (DUF1249 family)